MTFDVSPQTIAEIEQRMEDRAHPVCTGHRLHPADTATYVDLPCGCQDVHYADGTVCFEHAHVDCDGTPEETR